MYDATRKSLLRGREDMLGLIAAQLRHKVGNGLSSNAGPVWVDVRPLKDIPESNVVLSNELTT